MNKNDFKTVTQIPSLPAWVYQDAAVCVDLPACIEKYVSLANRDSQTQEKLILEDLLACLMGFSGEYICKLSFQPVEATRTYTMDDKLPASFKQLIWPVLQVASSYCVLRRFESEKSLHEYGQVNNALAEALGPIICSYQDTLVQVESLFQQNKLNLAKLNHILQEPGRLLEELASILNEINSAQCLGGQTLNVLQQRLKSYVGGVPKLYQPILQLMQSAARPFFRILRLWLKFGQLNDPCGDFMISKLHADEADQLENSLVPQDPIIWREKFIIVHERIPQFLAPLANSILEAGRYMGILRQSQDSQYLTQEDDLDWGLVEYQKVESDLGQRVQRICQQSSHKLLRFLLERRSLRQHLAALKLFFLCDRSDFLVNFLKTAASELSQPLTQINRHTLFDRFQYALATSSTRNEPLVSSLKPQLHERNLLDTITCLLEDKDLYFAGAEALTGYDVFTYMYACKWPIKLILNDAYVLSPFQLISRHLFYCKHVEHSLESISYLERGMRASTCRAMPSWLTTCFILRKKMLSFIQSYQLYMFSLVIEPYWRAFMHKVDHEANSIEMVNVALETFIQKCHDDCFLSDPPMLAVMMRLNITCIRFSNFLNNLKDFSEVTKDHQSAVALFESQFTSNMIDLISRLRGDANFEILLNQLDLNDYYTTLREDYAEFMSMAPTMTNISATGEPEEESEFVKSMTKYPSPLNRTIFLSDSKRKVRKVVSRTATGHNNLQSEHNLSVSTPTLARNQHLSNWISSVLTDNVSSQMKMSFDLRPEEEDDVDDEGDSI